MERVKASSMDRFASRVSDCPWTWLTGPLGKCFRSSFQRLPSPFRSRRPYLRYGVCFSPLSRVFCFFFLIVVVVFVH